MITLGQEQLFEEADIRIYSNEWLWDIKSTLETKFPTKKEIIEKKCKELQKKCRTTNNKPNGLLLLLDQQTEEIQNEAEKLLNTKF